MRVHAIGGNKVNLNLRPDADAADIIDTLKLLDRSIPLWTGRVIQNCPPVVRAQPDQLAGRRLLRLPA